MRMKFKTLFMSDEEKHSKYFDLSFFFNMSKQFLGVWMLGVFKACEAPNVFGLLWLSWLCNCKCSYRDRFDFVGFWIISVYPRRDQSDQEALAMLSTQAYKALLYFILHLKKN